MWYIIRGEVNQNCPAFWINLLLNLSLMPQQKENITAFYLRTLNFKNNYLYGMKNLYLIIISIQRIVINFLRLKLMMWSPFTSIMWSPNLLRLHHKNASQIECLRESILRRKAELEIDKELKWRPLVKGESKEEDRDRWVCNWNRLKRRSNHLKGLWFKGKKKVNRILQILLNHNLPVYRWAGLSRNNRKYVLKDLKKTQMVKIIFLLKSKIYAIKLKSKFLPVKNFHFKR